MKKGDKFPVSIQGVTVVEAEVSEVNGDRVTLVIPGTKVVMATRTELAPEVRERSERDTAVIIDGVVEQPENPVTPESQDNIPDPTNTHQAPPRPIPEHAQEAMATAAAEDGPKPENAPPANDGTTVEGTNGSNDTNTSAAPVGDTQSNG